MEIEQLQRYIRNNKYEISLHAQQERCDEKITLHDIEQAFMHGEIIEDYPQDKRGHSYLVLGYSRNKPIHIVCALLPDKWLRIITVYIPQKPKWIDPEHRRRF